MDQKKFDKELNSIMDRFDKLLVQANLDQNGRLNNLGKEITRASAGNMARLIMGKRAKK